MGAWPFVILGDSLISESRVIPARPSSHNQKGPFWEMAMEISDRLKSFLESEVQKIPKLEEENSNARKEKEKERKSMERSEDYQQANIDDKKIQRDKLKENQKSKLMPGTLNEGKKQIWRKNFIAMAWYLINEEIKQIKEGMTRDQLAFWSAPKDADIFKWISGFLTSNHVTKPNGKYYAENDIKRFIYDHTEGKDRDINKSHLESLFSHIYSNYEKPRQ